MEQFFIATGTITYAMKGRDVLRRGGFSAELKRLSGDIKGFGCGYGITARGDREKIVQLLEENGVRYLRVLPR